MKQLHQIRYLFISVIAACLVAGETGCSTENVQSATGQNFITNGNFAKGETGKLPEGWHMVAPNQVLAPTFKLVKGENGEKFLMAQGNGRKECFGYVSQKITLPENTTFLMRVVFRVDGIEDVNRNLVHGIFGDFNNGIFEYHREGKWIVGEHKFPGKGKNCEARLFFRFSPKGNHRWPKPEWFDLDPLLMECEDFSDKDVDILDPVQTTAGDMDPKNLNDCFGKDITFHGAIDTQNILPNKTPEEVKEHAHKTIEIPGKNGGYIFAPCNNIQSDTSMQNIEALYQAVLE